MKKIMNYFLIAGIFVTVQFFGDGIVKAQAAIESAATSIAFIDQNAKFPIPMLAKLDQISPNQIQISYDRDVDINLGTKSTDYWIQDLKNDKPEGIATLGKNDKVNFKNSLTNNKVKIESKDGSAKNFTLTFNQNITKGAEYKLIICYITVEGAPQYNGDNGMAAFVGK